MWTLDELLEMRDYAKEKAKSPHITNEWGNACLGLASAADRLACLTIRIEKGEIRAVTDEYAFRPPLITD